MALPKIWSVPSVIGFADLIMTATVAAAAIAAVVTSVLLLSVLLQLQQWLKHLE